MVTFVIASSVVQVGHVASDLPNQAMEPPTKRCKTEDEDKGEEGGEECSGEAGLDDMPAELRYEVAKWLSRGDLIFLRGTCRKLRDTTDDVLYRKLKLRGNRLRKTWVHASASMSRFDEMMAALPEDRHAVSVMPCNAAAHMGDIALLARLHDTGYQWDETTTAAATRGGHLGVFGYMDYLGCEWTKESWTAALVGGHLAMFERLILEVQFREAAEGNHDFPYTADLLLWAAIAASAGHRVLYTYILLRAYVWRIRQHAHVSPVEVLALVIAQDEGVSLDSDCCRAALANEQMATLEYLHPPKGREWPCASQPCEYGRYMKERHWASWGVSFS